MLIAESIARLFFRNAIAIGFRALQVPGITRMVEDGEDLEVDLERWRVRNLASGAERPVEPYSPLLEQIIGAGGIIGTLKGRIATDARFKHDQRARSAGERRAGGQRRPRSGPCRSRPR